MSLPIYPSALILAHPQLSHEQALDICRREGLLIVQTKRGNFRYESSSGLNVHVSSVSRAPLNGIGKQQRIKCGRDSRRDGKLSESSAASMRTVPPASLPAESVAGAAAGFPQEAA